eukprot:2976854-Rhodomonas_salina.3
MSNGRSSGIGLLAFPELEESRRETAFGPESLDCTAQFGEVPDSLNLQVGSHRMSLTGRFVFVFCVLCVLMHDSGDWSDTDDAGNDACSANADADHDDSNDTIDADADAGAAARAGRQASGLAPLRPGPPHAPR